MDPKIFLFAAIGIMIIASIFSVREEWGRAAVAYLLMLPLLELAGV